MLWRTFAEARVSLSEGGAVATHTLNRNWSLTTTGTELSEGKHFWEVELLSGMGMIFIGISRPNLDSAGEYLNRESTDCWFISAGSGGLYGSGKFASDAAGYPEQGDRVGMLLDLDDGSLRFFKNGVKHGPGFPAGSVTGPVVAAVHLYNKNHGVRLLPSAEPPANM
jgi:hypothetical protein